LPTTVSGGPRKLRAMMQPKHWLDRLPERNPWLT
jgi:hypothetical protein